MKARAYLLLTVIALGALLSGCYYRQDVTGSGDLVERQLAHADFDGIELLLGAALSIIPSSEFGVTLTADDNIIDLVTVYPADGGKTLRFGLDNNSFNYIQTSVSIEIHMPVLTALRVEYDTWETRNAATQVTIESGFSGTDNVVLELHRGSVHIADLEATHITVNSGYSKTFVANVTCDKLDLSTGGGKATMTGSAGKLSLASGGGSDVDLSELTVVDADVHLSYSATASVHVTGSLSGIVAEDATLEYEGYDDIAGLDVSGLVIEQQETE